MSQFLYYIFQELQDTAPGEIEYRFSDFVSDYGVFIGVTTILLIVLILLYIKKHRDRKNG
ncbi:MAG: hypothetical protein CL868_07330 [Cytophagaceae bacterium]|nr:hypothetical protein [Cytophagaceae bacterium]|tara:strand:+ start:14702 stop:14881 length:180 start_codon:yes stop_codon:yes gene_type:complete